MLFSVIVPIYNVEPYIHRCVDSVLQQTFKDFELILVDDGSPDNCGSICDEYAKQDDRITVIHKENGGLASARNSGINAARGDYIALVDADDYIDDVFLAAYNNAIAGTKVSIVHSGLRYLPSGRELQEKFPVNQVMSGIEMIECAPNIFSEGSIPFSVRYCFKKSFLDRNNLRFNENIKYAEDSPFNLNAISKAESMICINSISYNYVIRRDSITQVSYKPTMTKDLDYYHSLKKEIVELLKRGRSEYEKDMAEKHIYEWLAVCIDNYSHSPTGFKLKQGIQLLNTSFVQDGVRFLLDNKNYNRKLQMIYYRAITHRSIFVYFFWKYGNLNDVIG